MKKRLLFVLAIIAAFSLIAAAPVSACNKHGRHRHQPPSGDQVMVLNNSPDPAVDNPGLYGCEDISWFGTIEIKGKTFGMALYSDSGFVGEPGEYGEDWRIFTEKFKTKDGVLKRCSPGRVLMAGYAEGSVDFGNGIPPFFFESEGTVDHATRYFKRWDGHAVHQEGLIGPGVSVAGLENVFGFHGTFEIYRPYEGPIKGTVMGEHWEPDFADQDCIDAGYVWRFRSAGEGGVGKLSHLGRVAAYSLTQCTIPGPDGTESVGTITFTAANGDELWIEHTMLGQTIGVFPGGVLHGFTFEGTWKAVGGTGRFTHATGSGTLDGAGDIPDEEAYFDGIPDGLMQLNLIGSIAYDRSGK